MVRRTFVVCLSIALLAGCAVLTSCDDDGTQTAVDAGTSGDATGLDQTTGVDTNDPPGDTSSSDTSVGDTSSSDTSV